MTVNNEWESMGKEALTVPIQSLVESPLLLMNEVKAQEGSMN
jgi:hypothetical protein